MYIVNDFSLSMPYMKTIITPKDHVICQRNVPSDYMPTIVETTSKVLSLPKIDSIVIPTISEMDFIMENEEETTLFPSIKEDFAIETNTPFHHLRYDINKYDITYKRYCQLESKISEIVKSYLDDKKRHYCLFVERDLLYTDSIPHYLSKKEYEKTLFITDSIQVGTPNIILWSNDKKINL